MTQTLCATCQFKRDVRTARSSFLLCQLSNTDETFPKYPPQPVRLCRGYRPASSEAGQSNDLLPNDPS